MEDGYGRIEPDEFAKLELRAHSLLAAVPIHDVWAADLPGGGPGRDVMDLRAALQAVDLTGSNAAVRLLFRLRATLGSLFSWDEEPSLPQPGLAERLSEDERRRSLVPPGTRDGPFQIVFVSEREAVSEVRNATVHAFSVFHLCQTDAGYRLYWAIYVEPVGRITGWYMKLIDPFRRLVVYPAILRRIRSAWADHVAPGAGDAGGSR